MSLSPSPSRRSSWVGCVAVLGLIGLFGGVGLDVSHQILKDRSGAFDTYYDAASGMRRGLDPYADYHVYRYVYPPLYAWMYQPLTRLPEAKAAHVMLAIDTFLVLLAVLLAARAMLKRLGRPANLASMGLVALSAAVIAVVPIHNELRGLETNSLLLLSFVLALHWLDRHPILAGLALAVAINVKYLPIVALPYLLLRRRWLAGAATALGTVGVALLPAITVGWHANLRYLRAALGGLLNLAGTPSANDAAKVRLTDDVHSLSITSTLSRLAATNVWPRPTVMLIIVGIVLIWVGGMLLMCQRRGLPHGLWPAKADQSRQPFAALLATEWAALVTFALIFSPNSQNRNLVLAIIPAALAAALLWFPRRASKLPSAYLATMAMIGALALPIAEMGKPFTVAWFADGWPCWILLAAFFLLARSAIASAGLLELQEIGEVDLAGPGMTFDGSNRASL